MDWTGGTRRRYAQTGKNNDIVQKQKAHFAKVRNAGQQHPPSSMPDFMREAVVSKGYQLTTAPQRGQSKISQATRGSSRNSTSAAARQRGQAAHARSSAINGRHGSRHEPAHPVRNEMKAASSRGSKRSRDQANSTNLTEEERALQAARRRLLARSDWLGLDASKPLKIDFPANRESYRVGKRRKVKKASPRQPSRGIQHRRVTPPFQHRECLGRPLLSDAGVDESIDIKIGTGAFGSQSQPSRLSRTKANTSMRQPSTEFGPLSEESMLLGEESLCSGSAIEPPSAVQQDFVPQHSDHMEAQELTPQNEYVPAALAKRQWPPLQSNGSNRKPAYVPQAPLMRPIDDAKLLDDGDYHYDEDAAHSMDDFNTYGDQPMETARQDVASRTLDHQHVTDEFDILDFIEATASPDERVWRKSMHIRDGASTEASMAALKSSSLHQTQSTLSYAPPSVNVPDLPPWVSPPMAPLRNDYLENISRHVSIEGPKTTTTPRRNPAPLHTMPHTNVDRDRKVEPSAVESTDNDEALWRQFVCCSQGSDSNSSVFEKRLQDQGEEVNPAPRSLFAATSDQPRSDRVTVGGSTFDVNSGTASSTRNGMAHTSMIGHPATVDQEVYDIEEDESQVSTPNKRSKSNIHASARQRNVKHFKRERKQSRPSALPKPSRFLPSTKIDASKQGKSVYDIPSTSD